MEYMMVENIDAFGAIVWEDWVQPHDPTPVWEQVHHRYAHGGGWCDFEGFEVLQGDYINRYVIQYPEDPPYHEIGRLERGIGAERELLIAFPHGWMMWSKAGERKFARID